jgi:hypothetical protein
MKGDALSSSDVYYSNILLPYNKVTGSYIT